MVQSPSKPDVSFWRDADLPGVEVRYSSYSADAFRKHTHSAYSIGYILTGRTTFELDGAMHRAGVGQLVLIGPEVVHACNPDPDSEMAYCMFYVSPEWLRSVAGEVFGRDVGAPVFPLPVVQDEALLVHWQELYRTITGGAGKLEKETLLVQGLADLVSRHARLEGASTPSGNKQAVEAVQRHLAENLADKVSLEELAEVANLSRYHLLRVFQAAVGLPPHAYQNQLRVELGKRLLAQSVPISQAAVEAGFVDQSHFSRVFKQFTGATPRQYMDAKSS